jgi:multidrug resistance efflux pump
VDRAAVAMQQKGSALKETRTQLARTKVASKLTGVVSLRNAEVGEISETGRELLRVVDLRNLEADVLVPPGDVARVAKGTPARVVLEGRRHNGTVKRVDPGRDVATGSIGSCGPSSDTNLARACSWRRSARGSMTTGERSLLGTAPGITAEPTVRSLR